MNTPSSYIDDMIAEHNAIIAARIEARRKYIQSYEEVRRMKKMLYSRYRITSKD